MLGGETDSLKLFRFRGIQVYLHWMWFLMAYYQIAGQRSASAIFWSSAEYLSLFLIVLIHEFGHAFATRQTGGEADRIVLWPFGGIAFVRPPPRPGAELWSIAAGPLVNAILWPLLMVAVWLCDLTGVSARNPEFRGFLHGVWEINRQLLIFNLLPVYPLDGGQILRSLLWFRLGRARSLSIATIIGLVALPILAAFSLYALRKRPGDFVFVLVMAFFLVSACLRSFRHAQALLKIERMPRHPHFACPKCSAHPPAAPIWVCGNCGNRFDAFATRGTCPHCRSLFLQGVFTCVVCGQPSSLVEWDRYPDRGPGSTRVIDI